MQMPSKYHGILKVLEEIFQSPEGHAPEFEYSVSHTKDLEGNPVDIETITTTPATLYARTGFVPDISEMFDPQGYVFSEVTVSAREFANYMRAYADLIESRLPQLGPPPRRDSRGLN